MALRGFTATTVNPGDPLTAQAWNEIVGALAEVYGELAGRRSLAVRVTTAGLDPAKVRIVARHANHPPVEAVRPTPTESQHTLVGLRPGAWVLHAEAEGYTPSEKAIQVPAGGELQPEEVSLIRAGAAMPDLFGEGLNEALAMLRADNIAIGLIFDPMGRSYSVQEAEQALATSPVLFHLPAAGEVVPPTVRVGLVVGVAPEATLSVTMPNLAGQTLEEARRTLEQLGLVLGKVEHRSGQ